MHTRRTFFAASSTAAVVVAAGAGEARTAAASPYDFAAVSARLARPFRHRQAFSTHRMADGAIAGYMVNSLNAYQFDYGDGPGTLHVLGIWYGSSVAMLVDDDAWRTYKIALVQQRRGDAVMTPAAHGGNPYARATSALDPAADRADLHGIYHDTSLAALVKRGATFFACDNALRGLATDIAVTYGTSDAPAQSVHAALRKRLLPGTLLVPAGVAAVNEAQENRFTYLPATV